MRSTTTRYLGLATGALAVAGALAIPGIADAQSADATFDVSPSTITVGQEVSLNATGCVDETIEQDELSVLFTIDDGGEIAIVPTDQAGNVPYGFTPPADLVGTHTFQAYCVQDTPDDVIFLFQLGGSEPLTINAAAPTSTTAAPTTTAKPAAAAATATRPAFTG